MRSICIWMFPGRSSRLQVAAQLVEVGLPADRPQRRLVETLQPRFHLEQPRRGRGQQIERPIVEEIRPYLKVEADAAGNGGVFACSMRKRNKSKARSAWQLKVRSTSLTVFVPAPANSSSSRLARFSSKNRTPSCRPDRQNAQENGHPREVSR